MPLHVAILLRRYIRLILSGDKTVESRLTLTRKPPLDRVEAGERIYFKASSGPFLARARVAAVETHHDLTPAKVDALARRLGPAVRGDRDYWRAKRSCRYATFVTLRDVEPCDHGPSMPPSRGAAWFVLPDAADPAPDAADAFELTLTRAAFTTRVLRVPPELHRFPADVYGNASRPGRPLALHMPDGRVVQTDLVARDHRFRWRGWTPYLTQHRLAVGDRLRFERLDLRQYRVVFAGGACSPPHERPAMAASPRLSDFASDAQIDRLIALAREEDLGPRHDDITSRLFVPASRTAAAVMRSRQAGRLAGAAMLPAIVRAYDPALELRLHVADAQPIAPGTVVAQIAGPLRSILAVERVALNFVTHLSGIASLTARYVEAAGATRAGVYDTRKTIPGFRGLAKYAVVCGGGHSHRMGLHDAVLVKDNHLAHLPLSEWPAALGEAISRARQESPRPAFVEIEVDSLEQLQRVLPLAPDLVLLDNMDLPALRAAVALRDRLAPRVGLEASGGVNLNTIAAIAQTGVERIAVGALTHSAPTLDLGLDIDP